MSREKIVRTILSGAGFLILCIGIFVLAQHPWVGGNANYTNMTASFIGSLFFLVIGPLYLLKGTLLWHAERFLNHTGFHALAGSAMTNDSVAVD